MLDLPIKQMDLSGADSRIGRLRMDEAGFRALATKLRDITGIHLVHNEKNMSLMAARLARIIDRYEVEGYQGYLDLLAQKKSQYIAEFVSAMTTNTTEFFREARHFELLSQFLPQYLKNRPSLTQRELRIWCAAASSGQEVYSILMTILEVEPQLATMNLKVLATDIDLKVLEKGSNGIYTDLEMQAVPPLLKQKYFRCVRDGERRNFVVKENLRSLITFAPFNLMSEQYPFSHKFDIIFCRNVLIYFDRETGKRVTEQIASVLKPSGYLFLGHSEAGIVSTKTFVSESSAFYRKI